MIGTLLLPWILFLSCCHFRHCSAVEPRNSQWLILVAQNPVRDHFGFSAKDGIDGISTSGYHFSRLPEFGTTGEIYKSQNMVVVCHGGMRYFIDWSDGRFGEEI